MVSAEKQEGAQATSATAKGSVRQEVVVQVMKQVVAAPNVESDPQQSLREQVEDEGGGTRRKGQSEDHVEVSPPRNNTVTASLRGAQGRCATRADCRL